MNKHIFLVISLLSCGFVQAAGQSADWLDEIVDVVVHHNGFHAKKANAIIEKYIAKDKAEIAALEKQQKHNTSEGVLAGTRELTYKGEMVPLNTSLRYHEGVAKYIRDLAENKKDRESFVQECKKLKKLNNELHALQKKYDAATVSGKAVVGAQIAAKKTHIAGIRAHMKAIKF